MGKLECIQSMKKHTGRVWNVSWNPKGDILSSCGEDKTIRLWSCSNIASLTGSGWVNKLVLAEGHKRTIREVSWSPCGKYLASASFDATICIWDNKSGQFECSATLEGHENEVKSVTWATSGHFLATCSRDKSVWIWEVADDDEYDCAAVLNAHTQDVKKVVWHPSSDLLASASYDGTIKLFREDVSDNDWICTATLEGHTSTVWSLAWDKTGDRLASCSDDCTVKIWKRYGPGNPQGIQTTDGEAAWKCICTLSGYQDRTIYDISWCHKTGLLATASGDNTICVFSEDGGSDPDQPSFSKVASEDRAHSQDVNSVAWNPTQPGLLASCSDDGEIKLWKFVE